MTYSVLIADDHPIFRVGLRHILEQSSGYDCYEASDGEQACKIINENKPDIAILDISMPNKSGFEVLQNFVEKNIHTKFIILTMYDDNQMIERAFDLSAKAYLLKEDAESELLECLQSVLANKRYLSQSIVKDTKSTYISREHTLIDLTQSEKKIVQLVGDFKTSREIAEQLFISVRTVQNHRQNITKKLNLMGSNALLKFAISESFKI